MKLMNMLRDSLTRRKGRTLVQWLWFAGWITAFLWADQALSTRWADSYGLMHPLAALATLYVIVAVVGSFGGRARQTKPRKAAGSITRDRTMKKALFALATLTTCGAVHAAITTSIDAGTSYIHLGKLSAKECKEILASPASASLKFAFDGRILVPAESLCHDGIKLDLVSEDPVVTTTKYGVTTWPLPKNECVAVAGDALKKHGVVDINHQIVNDVSRAAAACSKSSNAVTVPL